MYIYTRVLLDHVMHHLSLAQHTEMSNVPCYRVYTFNALNRVHVSHVLDNSSAAVVRGNGVYM